MAEEAQASGLRAEELLSGAREELAHSPEIVRLGKHYDASPISRAAAAFERIGDWRAM